ncbi:MAG: RNA-directed DNA polymerase [Lachnospiraceae bacterium]|nr:RNA-directed DNA polymerase [Lachnospiraceae bacterium]
MKRYDGLFEKIATLENLKLAHRMAKKGKKDYKQVQMVNSDPDYYLGKILEDLLNGTYHTSPYVKFEKFDRNKVREIYKLPYYPDRIVHWAIMIQLEPILMGTMIDQTCAALPGRGIHHALRIEDDYLTNHPDETTHCLKLDVKKFFQNIDKDILFSMLKNKIKDKRLLDLLEEIIYSCEDTGIPIGNYSSQYFANFYLAYFDHWVKEVLKAKYYIRYMDDMVIFHSSKEVLHDYLNKIQTYLHDNLKLEVKSNYQIFPVEVRGVDFVGYRHFRSFILLRKTTAKKFKRKMLNLEKMGYVNDNGYCSIRSYEGWFKSCNGYRLYHKYVDPIRPSINRYELRKGVNKSDGIDYTCAEYGIASAAY